MPTISEQIIDEFITNGWKSNPFDKLLPMLREERAEAPKLAHLMIDRLPEGGTFFDLLLSHLTEPEFENLITTAVERMHQGRTEALDSVFSYASLQFPYLLTTHLRALFELCPNESSYYANWPWRGADEVEIDVLKKIVENPSSEQARIKAWRCLIETRRAECITFASQRSPSGIDQHGGMEAYAHLAGFDISDQSPRRLHTDSTYHIIFPARYFDDSLKPAWLAHANHPTWQLRSESSTECLFGGESTANCGYCGNALHRLINLQNADAILQVQMPQIELCTCLSCLGWEVDQMFFSHDEAGLASSLTIMDPKKEPEFLAQPLKQTSVAIVQSPSRWAFQDWALSNSRENLNRIGGVPAWIQDSQYPNCPQCNRMMSFVMQLDSDLPTMDGEEWLWGSGGICYLFWCDSCSISGNLWQCT